VRATVLVLVQDRRQAQAQAQAPVKEQEQEQAKEPASAHCSSEVRSPRDSNRHPRPNRRRRAPPLR